MVMGPRACFLSPEKGGERSSFVPATIRGMRGGSGSDGSGKKTRPREWGIGQPPQGVGNWELVMQADSHRGNQKLLNVIYLL
ncbi:MAG: hypothetical protein EAZ59_22425 [Oscillatoriales cyanobacterium]|nr:MAG: hypothetical protein EAZ59_22425 [Oscillatoriales cyanobacterium]